MEKELGFLVYRLLRTYIIKQTHKLGLMEEITDAFSVTIGLYQRSALSPYLFALVLDELIK